MNILHHKSWHVRNKDNIERVRKDEAQAAEEERIKQNKISLAEQEARIDLLRQKSRTKLCASQDKSVVVANKQGHLNLFEDLEKGFGEDRKNKEYEEEKRLEKEKYEKSIGLLTYLGQSSLDKNNEAWYKKVSHRKSKSNDSKEEVHRKNKSLMDPLNDMKTYLEKKKKAENSEKSTKPTTKSSSLSHQSISSSPGPKSIEQLRAERLKREQIERQKAEIVIAKSCGKLTNESDIPILDDRKRRYNSQYNPDFVKRKRY